MTSSIDINRRAFLRGKISQHAIQCVRPPWAIAPKSFEETCQRCGKCIQSCSKGIIVQGEGGFPEVNFNLGSCTFCAACVEACESNSFQYFKNEELHDICASPREAWNLDVSIKFSDCLSINTIICRICSDNCSEEAITFQLQTGGISIPSIDHDKCNGCGECLFTCPEKAISIQYSNS